jgi:cell division septum initiation protein DivIVA
MAVVQTDVERQLPLVRRGYDPYEVQRLVGVMSNEMSVLTRRNEELRARVVELQHLASPSHPSPGGPGVDDARRHAADLVAAAEREGNAIRHRARIDADRILELATERADEIRKQQAITADQLRVVQAQLAQLATLLEPPKATSNGPSLG